MADELRLGLRGQVRRVLAPRGVKVVQRVQIEYRWRYLLLGVDPRTGALAWRWLERFRQAQLKPVLAEWGLDAIVWDGAGAHRDKQLRDLPTERIVLPPYSPELNPAERVFAEVRRRVEGRVYATLDAKQAEVEVYLAELAVDPARVRRLCGWGWILDAFRSLPPDAPPRHPAITATLTKNWYDREPVCRPLSPASLTCTFRHSAPMVFRTLRRPCGRRGCSSPPSYLLSLFAFEGID